MAPYLYANYGGRRIFSNRLLDRNGKYCCSHCWYKDCVVYGSRLVMGKEGVMSETSEDFQALFPFEQPHMSGEARFRFLESITAELNRAYKKHGAEPWSRHEFYAILLEEVDELWDDIKADKPLEDVLKELVQVAAMCVRYAETGEMAEVVEGLE